MRIFLLTQGSQGLVAIRNLFAVGVKPTDVFVQVCNYESSLPLIEFLKFNKMPFGVSRSNASPDLPVDSKRWLLVSIGWKYLLKPNFFSKFKQAINFHPGLLPEYKGCFSTSWSIINDERFCGYSFHLINEKFDDGKIIFRKELPILQSDNAFTLNYRIINDAMAELPIIIAHLEELPRRTNVGGVYYPNKLPYEGRVDADWDSAQRLRFIKALYFPPHDGAYEYVDGQKRFLEIGNEQ